MTIRLLNSLEQGDTSVRAIKRFLAEREATPETHYVTAGVSGWRTAYRLPDGRCIFVKQIRRVRLPDTCRGCRFNSPADCHEGFYGIRLYRDPSGTFLVGVCIRRMDLCQPLHEFLNSDRPKEVLRLQAEDYARLTA